MKGLEFTILKLGEVENDEALNLQGLSFATVDDPHRKSVWLRLSSIAVFIRHPEAGNILFDTGNCPGNQDGTRLPGQAFGRTIMNRDDFIDRQLANAGVSVEDVDIILLSHAHFDHMGGLGFFSGTKAGDNVFISREELETGLMESHRTPDGYNNAYFRDDFDFPGIRFHFMEEGEFAPGIDLVRLAGHTAGGFGMLVHCEGGTYLFPSDAVYLERNFGPPPIRPGLVADTIAFDESVRKIRKLQQHYHATIIYPHDLDQLSRLKTAPYFYR